jgi:peroxiredoxin
VAARRAKGSLNRRLLLVSRTLLVSTLVLALLAPAPAQEEGPDESAVFHDRLGRLLDRWNDDAPQDRLGKAIELCEKHLREKPEDAQAQLELVRLKLAHGDFENAKPMEAAAIRAEDLAATQPERLKEARALRIVASSLVSKPETQDQADKFEKDFVALYNKLAELAGSREAADQLIAAERERVTQATLVNELGRTPPPLLLDAKGQPIPGSERRDTEGKPVRLDMFLGKVVIVDFWSASYEPYRKEVANTLAVCASSKDKVEVIGVSLDRDRAALDAFVKENNVPWRQLFSGKGPTDDTALSWRVPGVRRFVIDQDGRVRFVNVRGDGLAAAIKQLVERPAKSSSGRK